MKLVISSAFMMGLALIVSLITNFAGLFPDDVFTAQVRSDLTILFLAIMMTVSLSRIPSRNLSPAKNPRDLIRGMLIGLVIAGIIPIVGFLILKDTAHHDYAVGLVFVAATPFAASVAPLSFILRGDMEHAARSTVYVYAAALLWIPFIIYVLLGKSVDMTELVKNVIYIIGVPLIVSRFITWVKIDKNVMAVVLNCFIFFLVWMSVSPADFAGAGAGIMIAFMLIVAMRTFGLGGAVAVAEKRMGIGWSQRVTDVLMMSYKNKGIAIALCMATMMPLGPQYANMAMVAIASSIVIEICWVVFMDSVLFSRKRMKRELGKEGPEAGGL